MTRRKRAHVLLLCLLLVAAMLLACTMEGALAPTDPNVQATTERLGELLTAMPTTRAIATLEASQ